MELKITRHKCAMLKRSVYLIKSMLLQNFHFLGTKLQMPMLYKHEQDVSRQLVACQDNFWFSP